MCAFLVEAEDARGDGIAVMMVVKEPAVNAGLAEWPPVLFRGSYPS